MTAPDLNQTGVAEVVDRVIQAHGGLQRWQEVRAVQIGLSSGGLAFSARGQTRTLQNLAATVATVGTVATVATVATAGQHVEFRGRWPEQWAIRFNEVGSDDGAPLREHIAALRCGRRRLVWSVTDVGAFAAAAL